MQVWNAVAGNKLYTFEGHKALAYSMCLILRKTFMYSVVLFAILLVDSFFFFFTFHERLPGPVSHASARVLGSGYYSYLSSFC